MTSFQPAALAASSERLTSASPDALAPEHRLDDQRPEEEGRSAADRDRGHGRGADQERADAGDEAQARVGVRRFTNAIGGASEPAGAEDALVEPFDRLGVVVRRRFEDEGEIRHRPASSTRSIVDVNQSE